MVDTNPCGSMGNEHQTKFIAKQLCLASKYWHHNVHGNIRDPLES